MSLIAELRVSGEPFALGDALAAAPEMHAESEWSVPAPAGPVEFVWVWGGDFEAFESTLPEDRTIKEFRLIEDAGDRRLYEVVLDEDTAIIDPAPLHRETSASQISMVTTSGGAVIEERLPDREALTEYIRICRDHGYEVELLRAYSADDEHRRYGLSEKQADALREALSAGYFQIPRQTDLAVLAERFDISEQAFSERLRRGVSSVLSATVGEFAPAAPTDAGTTAKE